MLASFIVRLRPEAPSPVGRNLGRSLHGVLFSLLREHDPALADRLHAGDQARPFTVSTLVGKFRKDGGQRLTLPDREYRVRYTTLSEPLFAALGYVLLERYAGGHGVEIDGQPYEVVGVDPQPDDTNGWAGMTDYRRLLAAAGDDERIELQFASPTTFRTGDINLLFPLKASVFGSLSRKWARFSPLPLEADMRALDWDQVAVRAHRLQTRVVRFGRGRYSGFVGRCEYEVLTRNPRVRRTLNALADFALYGGVGHKTTQGMGQVRRVAEGD